MLKQCSVQHPDAVFKKFMQNWPPALMGCALPAIYFEYILGLTLVLPLVFSAAAAGLAGPANILP